MAFNASILKLDPEKETNRIADFIAEMTRKHFRRKGAVVGLSGGIDSALTAELCVKALGKDRVLALILPERESSPVSAEYGLKQAEKLGLETITVDITDTLDSMGVYAKRDEAIRGMFPDFDQSMKFHITLPQDLLDEDRISFHSLVIEDSGGNRRSQRISGKDWLKISASQNVKQRVRMVQLFYYADRFNYIMAGTTNKTEVLQGFFVKYGDGGVDIEPLAHLYKTQVFQLSSHLGVVREIVERPPSPDTYSLPVSDKEFYFRMDYELLDLLLYAHGAHIPMDEIEAASGLKREQVERAFKDFKAKDRATWHMREMPPSLEPAGH
jgi:NAD+ synthase